MQLRLDGSWAEPSALAVEAIGTHRDRLLTMARQLTADDWAHASRCGDWTVHDVVLHLIDTAERLSAALDGTPVPGRFDPNRTPEELVARRRGQPVARTLEELEAASTGLVDRVRTRHRSGAPLELRAVWGAEVDWSAVLTHIVWDGVVHERDVALPLGRDVELDSGGATLVSGYGLMLAGLPLLAERGAVAIEVPVGAPATTRLALTVTRGTIVVELTPEPGLEAAADPGRLIDALSGRAPDVGTVLPELAAREVEQLGRFGRFLQG